MRRVLHPLAPPRAPRARHLRPFGVALLAAALALAGACSGEGSGAAAPTICQGNCDCDPPRTVCVENRCVPGCPATDCETGFVCNLATGFCQNAVPQTCRADADCFPPDGICENGTCTPGCTLTCCDGGTICDRGTGRCTPEAHNACRDDGDCEPPRTLCVGGVCGPSQPCNGDLDCAAPAVVCLAGFCRDGCARSGCAADETCEAATGRCRPVETPPGCTTDAGCAPPATVCEAGSCVPGCDGEGAPPCPAGQRCEPATGRCVPDAPQPCTADAGCAPPDTVCEDGDCVPGCAAAGAPACGADERCDPETGRCGPKPDPGSCTADVDCAPPATVCGATRCVPGCGETGCTGDLVCDAETGRCRSAPPPPCQTDAACDPPETVCLANQCAPGCAATGCDAGQRCDPTSGRCVPDGPPPCQTDAACDPPETICVGNQCIEGCFATGCSGGERCDGDSGRCVVVRENLPVGEECTSSAECASGWCTEVTTVWGSTGRFCTHFCCDGFDCPPATGCLYNLGTKFCVPAWLFQGSATFSGAVNAPCSGANDCRDGVCNASAGRCEQACCTDGDCATGYCALWQTGASYTKFCDLPILNGWGPVGAPCQSYEECWSGLCMPWDDGTAFCTGHCCSSRECPQGYRCNQIGTADFQGGYYFLNLCQPAGPGTLPTGEPCDAGALPSDCDSGLCVDGTCADICCDDGDCPTGLRCLPSVNYHADGGVSANVGACR